MHHLEVGAPLDTTNRCFMIEVEICTDNDELMLKIELPFIPIRGEHIAIEKDDYFKYYIVIERWIRIGQDNKVAACVSVQLKD
jgi:hypothetical protein